tara:strand:+ start:24941 stop:25963 length:1023 start_codon:yes stop_codon:yes gene_type:complete
MPKHSTDIVIIGAGPVGLFAVFELGLLDMKCHIIDNLDKIGGQCSELYPEKPIFDIPSRVKISAQELVDDLMEQCKPFNPYFHLNQNAEKLEKNEDGNWKVTTNIGEEITAKCIVIAAGAGSFVPRKPPIEDIEKFENKTVFYSIRDKNLFNQKKVIIAGGGDSAIDWVNELSKKSFVTLIHRREEFRAAPDSVNKMNKLRDQKKINFYVGQIKSIYGSNGEIKSVNIYNKDKEIEIKTDFFLPFYGLKTELGPISNWNLKLENNQIVVDTEKFETSIPKIFSIGDINIYPGKLKLILSGFHEAALMARKCAEYCYPGKKIIFRYTTSSKDIQKKLGVKQ